MLFETTYIVGTTLVFLRIIIAIVFFSSGLKHAQNPIERGKSIGLSPQITKFLGIAEMVGAVSITLGLFTQIGALILIGAMVGAMYKKIAVWKTGFFAEKGYGWHYDLLLLCGLLVIFTTDGGYITLT